MEKNVKDDWDAALKKLEEQRAVNKQSATDDEEYESEDVESSELEALTSAQDILQRTAILLEFLTDDTFCKTITKREREAINRHLQRLYVATDEVTEAINALRDEDEEDE